MKRFFVPRSAASVQGATVLLVEDEPMVRKVVARMLEQAGYRVLPASTAEEACGVLVRHAGRIDLLLTDVVLRGTCGMRLAEGLVRCRPEMRVLFMTGYPSYELGRRDFVAHSAPLIGKPFTAEELLIAVCSVLATAIPEPRRSRASLILEDASELLVTV